MAPLLSQFSSQNWLGLTKIPSPFLWSIEGVLCAEDMFSHDESKNRLKGCCAFIQSSSAISKNWSFTMMNFSHISPCVAIGKLSRLDMWGVVFWDSSYQTEDSSIARRLNVVWELNKSKVRERRVLWKRTQKKSYCHIYAFREKRSDERSLQIRRRDLFRPGGFNIFGFHERTKQYTGNDGSVKGDDYLHWMGTDTRIRSRPYTRRS